MTHFNFDCASDGDPFGVTHHADAGTEVPEFTIAAWTGAVAAGETRLDYYAWAQAEFARDAQAEIARLHALPVI
jgi:hypothetical protein